jgi:cytoskeletal protein RodZ
VDHNNNSSSQQIQTSKVVMQTMGHILKKTREGKSLTIEQVNKKTKIHSDVLNALEEGRCDQILSYTYVKSFLKKYCAFLGLDPVEIFSEYSTARHEKVADKPMQLKPAQIVKEKSAPIVKEKLVEAPAKKPAIPITMPSFEIPKEMYRYAVITGAVVVSIAVIFGIGFIGKKVVGAFRHGRNENSVYTIQQKKKPASATASARSGATKKAEGSSSFKEVAVPQDSPISVAIKTKKSVLVKIRKDGVLIAERVLPKGSREIFKANDNLDLYIAKGEAVDIIINGKPLGSPGKGIKYLEITRKGMKVR